MSNFSPIFDDQKSAVYLEFMRITYIHHSCFLLESTSCAVLVDYWKDTRGEADGIVHDLLENDDRPLYVLCTHFHQDHYNPEILSWKSSRVRLILSKDILRRRRPPLDAASWMVKGGVFEDEMVCVRAFGSTDSGVSYSVLMKETGQLLFHSGDMGNWRTGDDEESAVTEKRFLGELKDVRKIHQKVDAVMLPVDPRIGEYALRGMEQFLKAVPARLVIPMHFTMGDDAILDKAAEIFKEEPERFWRIRQSGDSILF